ncbi:MAG: chemotaxis response regulator protein-glutamate methylesterase [Leptospira sp.]|nr:chemotaxis response regulator protein-glutamate methylesterase [Leptospira sp.]
MVAKKIRVLVIDDSSLVRTIISDLLNKEKDIEVIATGKTGLDCIELVEKLRPDLVTLDIEMPVMDGITALIELSKRPEKVPVIMLSVLTQKGAEATFMALELGAIDFIPKPSSILRMELSEVGGLLIEKIHGYFHQEISHGAKKPSPDPTQSVRKERKDPIKAIGIGTSTGGPSALHKFLHDIPANFRTPIFIVQHMPAGFTKAFADRLNDNSAIRVKEAENGERVEAGTAYLAPGDYHMKATRSDLNISIELDHGSQVNGHRPSIDVTLDSLRLTYGTSILGVIMTGMGKDGAHGIKAIRDGGGFTIAQDEKTSVVFGMNRQSIEMGAVDSVLPLEKIAMNIVRIIEERGN